MNWKAISYVCLFWFIFSLITAIVFGIVFLSVEYKTIWPVVMLVCFFIYIESKKMYKKFKEENKQ